MKLWNYYKIIKFPKGSKSHKKTYGLSHNEIPVEKIQVINYKSHHLIYKDLRAFKTSQYEIAYLMRNKKGFNTTLFRMNYDVVVTDKNGTVINLLIDVKPGYISEYFDDAFNIYFFVVGQIKFMNLKVKDQLNLSIELWDKLLK
ncbi:MAG: hypothetical protein KAG04_01945 [Mycoplasmataceae bacterium]|nr:hypothetical protein [Mycoplasmataceae bacterium]